MRRIGLGICVLLVGAYLWGREDTHVRRADPDRPLAELRAGEAGADPIAALEPDDRGPATDSGAERPEDRDAGSGYTFEVRTIDGNPIAGASLGLTGGLPAEGKQSAVHFTTDDEGRARVAGPIRDHTGIWVRHPDYPDVRRAWTRASHTTIVLEPGREIRGRVTFPDGLPAPYHNVVARRDTALEEFVATTDEDGRFRLRGLPDEELAVRCDGGTPDPIRCRPGGECEFELNLSLLRIRIRDPQGEPVASAELRADFAEFAEHRFSWDRVPSGARTTVVEPGKDLRVSVRAKGYRAVERVVPAWSRRAAFHDVVVDLEPAPKTIVLLDVRSADGRVPPVVHVTATPRDGSVPATEHKFRTTPPDPIELRGLEPVPHLLTITANNEYLLKTRIAVKPSPDPGDPVEVRLPGGARVTLQWADPPQGVDIRLRSSSGVVPAVFIPFKGGFYSLPRIPDGDYDVEAVLAGEVLRREPTTIRDAAPAELDWTR